MRQFFLIRIRLTTYFMFFLLLFLVLVFVLPKTTFSSGALTLFSVNSFLYGFYLAPILTSQKARIDDLHRTARSEANAIFEMALSLKNLPTELRNGLQTAFDDYLKTCSKQRRPGQGEKQYESLIGFCVSYSGDNEAEIKSLLEKLVKNQQNRTQFSMLLANKIFSHEWIIMLVLYGITTGFILTIKTGDEVIYRIIAGLLAAGLTMLVVIVVKLSTLTHKRAHDAWKPYQRLLQTRYYSID
ncbi:MAG: rane protein of unknown function [Candidatus Saccharibacteria bacterium]|nr:rane protein of unknown function [Candidatus Saccharibacteria bacterium]